MSARPFFLAPGSGFRFFVLGKMEQDEPQEKGLGRGPQKMVNPSE